MMALGAAWAVWQTLRLRASLKNSTLWWLSVAYGVLTIGLGLLALAHHTVTARAAGYGVIVNLRFLLFFWIVWAAVSCAPWLMTKVPKLVVVPGLLVVGFALAQVLLLPPDFLQHFGYGAQTIAPFTTVDDKLEYVRAQATLRGPNPLGAYLVIIIPLLVALVARSSLRKRWQYSAYAVLAGLALYLTYSRSAYIGAVVAIGILGWVLLKTNRAKKVYVGALVLFFVVGAAFTLNLKNNSRFANTFFHTDTSSQSARSSNEDRARALQAGVDDVLHEPLGRGPGTAGPASAHNNHPVRLAENYFLQIGQEVGWVGLGLFVLINCAVAWRLWRVRSHPLALGLLASLAGLAVINMLSHAWTDDTLGLLWWGLAGVALALPLSSVAYTKDKS